jgi:hypothetical protein
METGQRLDRQRLENSQAISTTDPTLHIDHDDLPIIHFLHADITRDRLLNVDTTTSILIMDRMGRGWLGMVMGNFGTGNRLE